MTRPYSDDLRSRAVAAVEGGMSRRQAAKMFSVGVSSVIRWVQRHRSTGSVSPAPMGGDRGSRIVGADRAWLLARIGAEPDLIQMFSPFVGIAGSEWGGMKTTSDGGRSWQPMPKPPGWLPLDGTVRGWFTDAGTGFALAYDGGVTTLSSTADGGRTWRVIHRWHD